MPRKFKIILATIWGFGTTLLTSVQVVQVLLAGKVGTQYGVEFGSLGVVATILFGLFAFFVSAFIVTIFMIVVGAFIATFAVLLGRGPQKMT